MIHYLFFHSLSLHPSIHLFFRPFSPFLASSLSTAIRSLPPPLHSLTLFHDFAPLSLSILRPSLVGGLYSLHLASEQLSPRSHLLHSRRLWQLSRLQNFLLCRRSVDVFASYVAVSILIQMNELLETFICSTQIVVI